MRRPAALLALCAAAAAGPVVEVDGGQVEGVQLGDVGVFRGIPFAAPPVGDLRWRPPQPAAPWRPKVLDGTDFRHNCYQCNGMGWAQPLSTQSEDCLYLNVYAPAQRPAQPKPVLLWIYGGGFQGGGGNETRLNGTWDVQLTKGEVVIVTFNYRMCVFGFAASGSLRGRDPAGGTGNYGILDQRQAMQWVQRNAAAFGGDPKRVFLVGQSAGACSVSNHMVRPKSWGLFQSAGMQSGAFYQGVSEQSVADKEQAFAELLKTFGCADVDCLLKVDAKELRAKQVPNTWEPVVDGVDLTARGVELAARGALAPVPVLLGSVSEDLQSPGVSCDPLHCDEADWRKWLADAGFNESEVAEGLQAYADEQPRPGGNDTRYYWMEAHAGADHWSTCAARRMARWVTARGMPAYRYFWTYIPKGVNGEYPRLAHHSCEQPFVFHVLSETPAQIAEDDRPGQYMIQPSEHNFSAAVVRYWVSFATGHVPKGPVDWPQWDDSAEPLLLFGDNMQISTASRVRSRRCDLWDGLFERRLRGSR